MAMEKFFLRSRALWGAAIPLIVGAAGLYGMSTDGLDQQLADVADKLALVGASGLVLWSRFKPDGAKLKVVPGPTA
jgi:hypothetical protein